MNTAFDPGVFSEDVRTMIRLFDEFSVDYLLIGGHAVFLHGHPRLTADVDFAYRCTVANAGRLYEALRVFWDGDVPNVRDAGELATRGIVVQFGRPPNRVDLLSAPDGLDFDLAWSRRLEATVGDGRVHVVALADLRAMKAAAGRPKDLDDLANLPVP